MSLAASPMPMTRTPALVLQAVQKRFGTRVALDGLSFSAPAGAITGIIGPNGAGKTTCFSIIGGLLQADAGRVDVLGRGRFDPGAHAGLLGLLPQDSELPGHARVAPLLGYLARLQGMSRAQAARDVDRVLALLSLADRRDSLVRELSHGMRRRVAVAQALLGSPALVLLDEPTSGLDPHLVSAMRELLCELRECGASLVVSSHVLADLEAICDHVVFVEAGRCIRSGELASVTARTRVIRIRLGRAPALALLSERLPELSPRYDGDTLVLDVPPALEVAVANRRALSVLLELDAEVLELRLGHSLEHAYLGERSGAALRGP